MERFNMREFLMNGLRAAVKEQPDSWTTDRAKAWHSEKILTDGDLAEIQALMKEKNAPPTPEPQAQEVHQREEQP